MGGLQGPQIATAFKQISPCSDGSEASLLTFKIPRLHIVTDVALIISCGQKDLTKVALEVKKKGGEGERLCEFPSFSSFPVQDFLLKLAPEVSRMPNHIFIALRTSLPLHGKLNSGTTNNF